MLKIDFEIEFLIHLFSSKIRNAELQMLAEGIAKIFPEESLFMYYVPPKTEGASQKISKGKLPDFYRNKVDDCRQLGLISRKRAQEDRESDDDESESENPNDGTLFKHSDGNI